MICFLNIVLLGTIIPSIEMVLLCQKDSYLKEYSSKVRHVKKMVNKNGTRYHVKLEDTIFFPEGGGQHSDQGTLGGVKVLDVYRDGDEAVHVMDKEFQVGDEVHLKINWTHRLDQMQQHTGQHLLSAIVNDTLGLDTMSWDCGSDECNVELDTKEFSDENMTFIEKICNDKIRQAIKVYATMYEPGDPRLSVAHSRGLPKDHKGLVRIVTIEGIDNNMCCGTQVSDLGQLQAIKLLRTSRGNKGRTLVHFVVGVRLLKKLHDLYNREKQMSLLLSGNSDNNIQLVQKNLNSVRKAVKSLSAVLKDLAVLEARSLSPDAPYTFVYRKEGDPTYVNNYVSEFKKRMTNPNALLVLITGEKSDGNLLVYRKSGNVQPIGDLICGVDMLDGNGKAKDTQFYGKLKRVERYKVADEAVKQFLNPKN